MGLSFSFLALIVIFCFLFSFPFFLPFCSFQMSGNLCSLGPSSDNSIFFIEIKFSFSFFGLTFPDHRFLPLEAKFSFLAKLASLCQVSICFFQVLFRFIYFFLLDHLSLDSLHLILRHAPIRNLSFLSWNRYIIWFFKKTNLLV